MENNCPHLRFHMLLTWILRVLGTVNLVTKDTPEIA